MKIENKVSIRKDGSRVAYTVQKIESSKEALELLKEEGVVAAVNYVLAVRAYKQAQSLPTLTKEERQLLRSDPELRKLVTEKLREGKK